MDFKPIKTAKDIADLLGNDKRVTGEYFESRAKDTTDGQLKVLETVKANNIINMLNQLKKIAPTLGMEIIATKKSEGKIELYMHPSGKDPYLKDRSGNIKGIDKAIAEVIDVNLVSDSGNSVNGKHNSLAGIQTSKGLEFLTMQELFLKELTTRLKTKWAKDQVLELTEKGRPTTDLIKRAKSWVKNDINQLFAQEMKDFREAQNLKTSHFEASNAVGASRAKMQLYFDSVQRKGKVKDENRKYFYELFNQIMDSQDIKATLRNIRENDMYKNFANTGGYQYVIEEFLKAREQGYKFAYAGTGESAAQHETLAFESALKMLPLAVNKPDTSKITGVRRYRQVSKKGIEKVYRKGLLYSKQGENQGVRYGEEIPTKEGKTIPFGALTKIAEITNQVLYDITKDPTLNVSEGGVVVTHALARQLGGTADFSHTIKKDEVKKMKSKMARALIKKMGKSSWDKLNGKQQEKKIMDALYRKALKEAGELVGPQDTAMDFSTDVLGNLHIIGDRRLDMKNRKVVDATNIRGTPQEVETNNVRQIEKQFGLKGVQAFTEKKNIDARSFGDFLSQDLTTMFVEADNRGKNGLSELFKYWDDLSEKLKDSKDEIDIKKRKIIEVMKGAFKFDPTRNMVEVTASIREELNKQFTKTERPDAWKEALRFTDEMIHLGSNDRFYEKTGEDIKRTDKTRYYYSDLGLFSIEDYGRYKGKEGSASMSGGADSIERLAGYVEENLSKEQIEKLQKKNINFKATAKRLSDKFRPTEKQVEALRKTEFNVLASAKQTFSSADRENPIQGGLQTDGTYIVKIGKGINAAIDIESIANPEYIDGLLINEDKLLPAILDDYTKLLLANGVDKNNIQYVVETGDWQNSVTNKQGQTVTAKGNAFYIPKGLKKDSSLLDTVQSVVNAVNNRNLRDEEELPEVIGRTIVDAQTEMEKSVQHKDGAEYQRVYKQKTPYSMMGTSLGLNESAILSTSEYEDLSKSKEVEDQLKVFMSDLSSGGVVTSMSDIKAVLRDIPEDEIRKMYESRVGKSSAGIKLGKTRQKLANTFDINHADFKEALKAGRVNKGLNAFVGRFPFMNGLDLKALSMVFGSGNIAQGSMQLGAALAELINADFDGDKIPMAFNMGYDSEESEVFGMMSQYQDDIFRKVGLLIKARAEEDPHKLNTLMKSSAASVFSDDELLKKVALASKMNKTHVGVLSNIASESRQTLFKEGLDEAKLSKGNEKEQELAASAITTRAFLEAIEQDAISAKKMIDTVSAMDLDDEATKIEGLVTRLGILTSKFFSKDPQKKIGFDSLIKGLGEIGVLKEENGEQFITGRVAEQALLSIEKMDKGKDILKTMFGGEYKSFADHEADGTLAKFGKIPVQAIKAAFKKSSSYLNSSSGSGIDGFIRGLTGKEYTPDKVTHTPDKTILAYGKLTDTLNKTEKAVGNERKAEEAKIVVAGKEAMAINKLSGAYQDLEGVLGNVGKKYTSVTALLKDKFPFEGGKSGSFGHVFGIMESVLGSESFDIKEWEQMSLAEKAKRFQYGEDEEAQKAFKAETKGALATVRGTYIHAGQEYRNNISAANIKSWDTPEDKQWALDRYEEDYQKAKDTYLKQTAILTSSPEERDLEIQLAVAAEKRVQELIQAYIKGKGAEAGIVASEAKIASTTPDGASIAGTVDLITKEQRTERSGEKTDILRIIDFKNFASGKIDAKSIAQVLDYIYFIKKIGKEARESDDIVKTAEEMRAQHYKYFEGTSLEETVEQLKTYAQYDDDRLNKYAASIVVNDTVGQKSAVYDIDVDQAFKDSELMTAITTLGVDNLPDDLKERLLRTYSKPSKARNYMRTLEKDDPDLFRRYQEAKERREAEKAKESGEYNNSQMVEYNELLKEQFRIELELYQLEQQKKALKQKDGNVTNINREIKALKAMQKENEELQEEIAEEGFSKQQQKKIDDTLKVQKLQKKYKQTVYNETFATRQSEADEREYRTLINKRLSYEKQIESAKSRINLSYSSKEKAALEDIVSITEEEIVLLDQKLASLIKSKYIRKEEAQSIVNQALIERKAMQANVLSQSKGAKSIWDMMANDTKRAMMRVTDYGLAMKVINSIPRGLQQIKTLTQQLEVALMNVRIVTGQNRQETEALLITYQKMGKQLGATTQEIADSSNTWLRQGYTIETVGKLIEASMKLSKLGMIESASATKYLTSALKGFKLEAGDAMSVVDRLTKLDMESAVDVQGLSEGLARVATSAQIAGLSMDQTLGMIATIGEVTQRDMGSIGDSLRTMLSRYGNVKAGVFTQMGLDDGGETTENINDIEKVLGKIGIKIRTSTLEMRDFGGVIDDIAEKWSTLDTVTKNAVATALGGTRQRENLLVLLENYDTAKELAEESANATGTADEKYAAYTDSLEASMKRLTNAWEELTMQVSASPWIKGMTDGLTFLTKQFFTLFRVAATGVAAMNAYKIPEFFKTKFGGTAEKVGTFLMKNSFLTRGDEEAKKTKTKQGLFGTMEKPVVSAVDKTTQAVKDSEKAIVNAIKGSSSETNGDPSDKKSPVKAGEVEADDSEKKQLEDAFGIDEAEQKSRKLRMAKLGAKRRIGTGVAAGAVAGIGAAYSMQNVTDNKTGQSVDATGGDKLLAGAVTGGLAGVGAAFGGPIGAMAGQLIGDVVSKGIVQMIHQRELDRKQRIAEAKEQLEALSGIKDSLEGYSELTKDANWDSEDYKKAKAYVDELEDLLRQNVDMQKRFIENVQTNIEEMKNQSFNSIVDKMTNGTAEERSAIDRQVRLTEAQERKKQTEASNEDLYVQNEGAMGEQKIASLWGSDEAYKYYFMSIQQDNLEEQGLIVPSESEAVEGYTVVGTTIQEKLNNAQQILEQMETTKSTDGRVKDIEIRKMRDYIKQLQYLQAENEKAEKQMRELNVEIGYLGSNLSDMTKDELKFLTYEGAIETIVQSMEAQGFAVRDMAGAIKSEYLPAIEAAIKSDSRMSVLIRNETKSYSDLAKAQDELNSKLKDSSYTQAYLKNLLRFATDDNVQKFKDVAIELGITTDALKQLVYTAEPENILQLAQALNITTSELAQMKDVLGDISLSDALMSPSEVRTKFSGYLTFFQDLSKDGQLTQESLEKVLASYPELLKYMQGTEDKSLFEKLQGEIFGDNTAQTTLYDNAIFDELLNTPKFFDGFKDKFKDIIAKLPEETRKAIGESNTFSAVKALLFGSEDVDLKKALSEYFDFTIEVERDKELVNSLIELQKSKADEEIKNLTEQKEALGKVNDERKKELDLIKAKEALENAKKEKKRVYRAGIGWTYESSDTAISEARDKLDQLETQKKQEELQSEIDRWNTVKTDLDNLPNQERMEALGKTFDAWVADLGGINEQQTAIMAAIQEFYNNTGSYKINVGEFTGLDADGKNIVDNSGKPTGVVGASEQFKADVQQRLNDSVSTLSSLKNEMRKAAPNTLEHQAAIDKYNKYFSEDFAKAYNDAKTVEGINLSLAKGIMENGEIEQVQLQKASKGVDDEKKKDTTFSFMTGTQGLISKEILDSQYNSGVSDGKKGYVREFDKKTNTWEANWKSIPQNRSYASYPRYSMIADGEGSDTYYAYVGEEGQLYYLKGTEKSGLGRFAQGTTSLPSSDNVLINELGTEAIVTPSGTVTALPSRTGIVPADITKNLWTLGEIAPTLVAKLRSVNTSHMVGNSGVTHNNDGTYIDNLNMTVYPTKDYDMDKFIAEAKARVRQTRQTR